MAEKEQIGPQAEVFLFTFGSLAWLDLTRLAATEPSSSDAEERHKIQRILAS